MLFLQPQDQNIHLETFFYLCLIVSDDKWKCVQFLLSYNSQSLSKDKFTNTKVRICCGWIFFFAKMSSTDALKSRKSRLKWIPHPLQVFKIRTSSYTTGLSKLQYFSGICSTLWQSCKFENFSLSWAWPMKNLAELSWTWSKKTWAELSWARQLS